MGSCCNLKICVASTSKLALPTIEVLLSEGHSVSLLTKPRKQSGRGRKEQGSEILNWTRDLKLPVFFHENDLDLVRDLKEENFDLVIAIAFGKLIKEPLLTIPRYGWLNLHFSLLPKYRGAAPVQRAILAGEVNSGITIFKLDSGMDTGPIYLQRELDIANLNTGEVLTRFAEKGAQEFPLVLSDILKDVAPIPQHGSVSLANKVSSEEAQINWSNGVEKIHRQIRAFSPKPGAWTTINGKRIRIESARISSESGKSGTILKTKPLLVGCNTGALEIISLCPESSRSMLADEWVRGARIHIGASFS